MMSSFYEIESYQDLLNGDFTKYAFDSAMATSFKMMEESSESDQSKPLTSAPNSSFYKQASPQQNCTQNNAVKNECCSPCVIL